MKTYVGVKIIQAQPFSLNKFNARKGRNMVVEDKPGYLIVYQPDGYESWSPAAVFEAAYLPLVDPTKISQAEVDAMLGDVTAITHGGKTTLCESVSPTGFVQVEAASCVDPKNYDLVIGTEICTQRMRDKLWMCLGFVLTWGRNGLKHDTPEA